MAFAGHIYFDTFPGRCDPVLEAERNIRVFQRLWETAEQIGEAGIEGVMHEQDGMAALRITEEGGW